MTPEVLMRTIRLATTGEMRDWLEELQSKSPVALAVLADIIARSPPARLGPPVRYGYPQKTAETILGASSTQERPSQE